jgi:hypothetical protein
MDIDTDIKRTVKNINIYSDNVTIDGKPLRQFIIDTIVDGIRKFHNPTSVDYKLYESQQQCIINDEEVARQCTQAQKAQIEEMQRRIAELNVNALVNKSKYDLINGE